MIPLVARWQVLPGDGSTPSHELALRTVEDIAVLIQQLSDPTADTAAVDGLVRPGDALPEHTLLVLIHGGFAYAEFDGAQSLGIPTAPAVESQDAEWPAGSGFPVDDLAAVIKEFGDTNARPASVRWAELQTKNYALHSSTDHDQLVASVILEHTSLPADPPEGTPGHTNWRFATSPADRDALLEVLLAAPPRAGAQLERQLHVGPTPASSGLVYSGGAWTAGEDEHEPQRTRMTLILSGAFAALHFYDLNPQAGGIWLAANPAPLPEAPELYYSQCKDPLPAAAVFRATDLRAACGQYLHSGVRPAGMVWLAYGRI